MRVFTSLLAVTSTLALCPVAFAAPPVAPPGNSGIDEYVPAVPDAAGDVPTRESALAAGGGQSGQGAGSPAVGLSSKAARELERQGADGRSAAGVLGELGAGAGQSDAQQSASDRGGLGDVEGESPLAALLGAAFGPDSGLGPALPLILVAVLVVALAVAVRRRTARRS